MEKPKLVICVIIISLAGILGIYTYAVMIEAKTVSIADLGPKYLGSLVEVEGYIKEVNAYSEGDLNLVLVDYESGKTVDVNVDSGAVDNLVQPEKLIPGAKIKVNGLVEDYKGELFIHVMSSEGIELLQTATDEVMSLSVILERPEVFEGIEFTVKGNVWNIEKIESITAFSFTLQNSSSGEYYSVNCIIFDMSKFWDKDKNFIHSGDEVKFEGTLNYYEKEGIWQIQSYEGKDSIKKIQ